jgi:hypothetical protein
MKDLTGKRYGNMVVTNLSHRYKRSDWYWLCKCDCGNEFYAVGSNIQKGDHKSCGCYRKKVTSEKFKTHGDSDTRFFNIWCQMRNRTSKKTNPRYADYGGRGINVCERWLDYDNFKADMYESYGAHMKMYGEKNTTIDRIDNDSNYEPGNCRWSTYAEQNRNRRNIRRLEYNGQLYCLTDLARKCCISRGTLTSRLRRGMKLEEALQTPVKR